MMQTTYTGCSFILSMGSAAVNYQAFAVYFSCGDTAYTIDISIYNAGFRGTTGKIVNDGLWHTVLVTYDSITLVIYVDGILDNTMTNLNWGNTASIASTLNTVGNSLNYLGQWTGNNRWIGKLKNVVLYDYVISSSYALVNSYQLAGSVIYSSGKYYYFRTRINIKCILILCNREFFDCI